MTDKSAQVQIQWAPQGGNPTHKQDEFYTFNASLCFQFRFPSSKAYTVALSLVIFCYIYSQMMTLLIHKTNSQSREGNFVNGINKEN